MEEKLGESKYDGKIRRVTLIKKVADYLDMKDGDIVSYWKIGNDIVIKKEATGVQSSPQITDYIPEGTPMEEIKMIMNASMDIADYFVSSKKQPTAIEMFEISEKVASHFPDEYSKEKKAEMMKISVAVAKNVMSKTKS